MILEKRFFFFQIEPNDTSAPSAGGAGPTPSQRAEIPRGSWPKSRNIKQKQYCNTFNKDIRREGNAHQLFPLL